ncbi:hypothetical protein CBL_06743 [Carabus blaptoides fortunei]
MENHRTSRMSIQTRCANKTRRLDPSGKLEGNTLQSSLTQKMTTTPSSVQLKKNLMQDISSEWNNVTVCLNSAAQQRQCCMLLNPAAITAQRTSFSEQFTFCNKSCEQSRPEVLTNK